MSFTAELERLADWLTFCGVDTVARESTGVYWIPLFELLESRGFRVLLVDARHLKNVAGRKSDVLDCQWLQQLMSYGLLSGAFRPSEEVSCLPQHTGPVHKAGLIAYHYTLNTKWEMFLLRQFGSDGLFTDAADRGIDLFRGRSIALEQAFQKAGY